jgi:hypothetical protein
MVENRHDQFSLVYISSLDRPFGDEGLKSDLEDSFERERTVAVRMAGFFCISADISPGIEFI